MFLWETQSNVDSEETPPSVCQALWWFGEWRPEEGAVPVEWPQRCHQPTVFSVCPLPLLRLHVPGHHIRRAAGRSHQRKHSERTTMTKREGKNEMNEWMKISPSLTHSLIHSQSAIESLFGASVTGVAYSLFAGQPLTVLGSTGPVLVFEKILFKFCWWVSLVTHKYLWWTKGWGPVPALWLAGAGPMFHFRMIL